jgi:hypothetical protein
MISCNDLAFGPQAAQPAEKLLGRVVPAKNLRELPVNYIALWIRADLGYPAKSRLRNAGNRHFKT